MAQQQMTPEQAQELQERLSRMSPEELRQYQKQNCIFCHISSGKQEAKKIYEDINCLGVLDINPANAGHVLLLPKEHYAVLPLVPDDILGHLGMVAKAISNVMLKALEAKGTTIFVANGAAAGQKAQHVMLHIIPRDEKDGLNISVPKYRINDAQLKQIKEKLAPKIKEVLNYAEQKKETKEKTAVQDKILGQASADQTIPAIITPKIGQREKLLTSTRIGPKEIGFAERQEIGNRSKVIDVENETGEPETEYKEPGTEGLFPAVKEKKSRKKRLKKEDNDEDDASQEDGGASSEKPKPGVDLDVIAKLFG